MNSSVWAVWAAQRSKGKNPFEFFLATYESAFFKNIVASALKSFIREHSHMTVRFFLVGR